VEDLLERIIRHAVRSEHPQRVQRLHAVADDVADVVRRRQSGSQRYPENFERRDAGNAMARKTINTRP